MLPFAELGAIILLNNTVMSLVLGPIFLPLLYTRIKKWGMLWTDIMLPEDMADPCPSKLYPVMVVIGALGGMAIGMIVSLGIGGQAIFVSGASNGGAGSLSVQLCVLPFLIALFYGSSRL
jgi:energy-coupling factor transport system substrate-specific component